MRDDSTSSEPPILTPKRVVLWHTAIVVTLGIAVENGLSGHYINDTVLLMVAVGLIACAFSAAVFPFLFLIAVIHVREDVTAFLFVEAILTLMHVSMVVSALSPRW